MDWKDELAASRREIDEIDAQLAPLFAQRMAVAKRVAGVKARHNLPVLDEAREAEVAGRAAASAGPFGAEATLLMRTLMALSRAAQNRLLFGEEAPLLPAPKAPKTENVTCAFQGLPGAWSEQALAQVFPSAARVAVQHFEDVFAAVKRGDADYGILPIENSQTGAIGEVYDLLRKTGCFIVGRTEVGIRQCLLAPAGTALSDVRRVLSHPEGFGQCRRFLKDKAWDLEARRNTAVAARDAAQANDGRTAAIGSRLAAQQYGLEILAPDVMDAADNATRFVVIAAAPELDAHSTFVSVTFSTRHRSGALCEVLLPFMAGGLNLARIESRPATGGGYRFFADVEGNILEESTAAALRQAAASAEYFEVLGCYRAI